LKIADFEEERSAFVREWAMSTCSSKWPKREGIPHDFAGTARRAVEQTISAKLSGVDIVALLQQEL
jgi:hypothetical protein